MNNEVVTREEINSVEGLVLVQRELEFSMF